MKRINLLREFLPHVERIGFLQNPDSPLTNLPGALSMMPTNCAGVPLMW